MTDPIATERDALAAMVRKHEIWAMEAQARAIGCEDVMQKAIADLDAVVEKLERQAQEIAALRADARAYEYLLHGDYLATKHYLPDLDEAQHKASVRERHASEVGAIDAARAKEAGDA